MAHDSVGLVLGAGGVVGGAYHAGALAALAEATGWDAARRRSDRRARRPGRSRRRVARRLSAPPISTPRSTSAPLSPEGELLVGISRRCSNCRRVRRSRAACRCRRRRNWRRRHCCRRRARRPSPRWPGCCRGQRATPRRSATASARLMDGDWPERPLWICALRLRDGARVVFGRDEVRRDRRRHRGRGVVGDPRFLQPGRDRRRAVRRRRRALADQRRPGLRARSRSRRRGVADVGAVDALCGRRRTSAAARWRRGCSSARCATSAPAARRCSCSSPLPKTSGDGQQRHEPGTSDPQSPSRRGVTTTQRLTHPAAADLVARLAA